MTGLFDKLRGKLRYGLLLKWCLDRLCGMGILICPWYLLREGTFGRPSPFDPTDYAEFEVYTPVHSDAPAMESLGDGIKCDYLEKLFAEGHHCLALRQSAKIVAYSWAKYTEIDPQLGGWRRPLGPDEAYLFNAWTSKELRGRSILPYLRDCVYRDLEHRGRTQCYSISEMQNTPAIRFKQKLGAQFLELHLAIEFFTRWKFDRLLRRYPEH